MIQILVQYFILNGHLDLANIGAIKLVKKEAFWQDNSLIAPVEEIIFDSAYNKPSRLFYNYLADELGVSNDQATLKFDEFINSITHQDFYTLHFGNIGTLHKADSNYNWISNYYSSTYYKDLQLPKSNHLIEDQNATLKSNKWGIWALFLFLVALAIILYKQL